MTVREQKIERLAEVELNLKVLNRLISEYKEDAATLRTERTRLKADIKRLAQEPEITEYILTVPTEHFQVDDRWIEDVVEYVRQFAYPKKWELQGQGKGKAPIFRVEFEIQATERSGCEYLQEVKDSLLYAGVHVGGESEIVQVGA